MKIYKVMLAIMLLLGGGMLSAQVSGDDVTVGVRETVLKSSPGALGRTVATVEYEDVLRVDRVSGDWLLCTTEDGQYQGWIHVSSIIKAKKGGLFSSSGSSVSSQATTEEVSLAGKGFNSDVEARYAAEENLDYSWVDRMEEEYDLPLGDLLAFLEEADLDGEGAAK